MDHYLSHGSSSAGVGTVIWKVGRGSGLLFSCKARCISVYVRGLFTLFLKFGGPQEGKCVCVGGGGGWGHPDPLASSLD